MTSYINKIEVQELIDDIGLKDFTILLEAFLRECGDKLESLERGSTDNDHEQVEIDSHTLKSLSRTFGAMELGDHCASLECAARSRKSEEYLPLFKKIQTNCARAIKTLSSTYL